MSTTEILSELSRIHGAEVALFQHFFKGLRPNHQFSAQIQFDLEGVHLKISKQSQVSLEAALEDAWGEFLLRTQSFSRTELYPQLLEHQADEHESLIRSFDYDLRDSGAS